MAFSKFTRAVTYQEFMTIVKMKYSYGIHSEVQKLAKSPTM